MNVCKEAALSSNIEGIKAMTNDSLYQYYQYAVLPQFGFDKQGGGFTWHKSIDIGPDETAHYFSRSTDGVSNDYVLVYEDYQGLGKDENFIREHIELSGRAFEYIEPTSESSIVPSYKLSLPVLCMYAHNVFGTFTVIRLI